MAAKKPTRKTATRRTKAKQATKQITTTPNTATASGPQSPSKAPAITNQDAPTRQDTPTPAKMGRGQPTKYRPEYCQAIIDHFNVPPYKTDKDGKRIANDMPMVQLFARKIGVSRETLHEWKRTHKEFSDAFEEAKSLAESMWVINTLHGHYNSGFGRMVAQNMFGWLDRVDSRVDGSLVVEVVRFTDGE